MFIDNKYTKCYYSIIGNARNRKQNDIITEGHHIVPKSLNGTDDINNIVNLTIKEHYICHRLLTKMTTGKNKSKMIYALWCMVNGCGRRERYIPCSRRVEEARNNASIEKSYQYRDVGNPFFGKKHSDATKTKISENNSMKRPEIREKCRGKRPGFKPHNHYNGWDSATKEKISQSLIGNKRTKESCAKQSNQNKGKIWINDMNGNTKHIKPVNLEEYTKKGWMRGRGKLGPRK